VRRAGRWFSLPTPPGWTPQSVLSIDAAGMVVGTVGWTGDAASAYRDHLADLLDRLGQGNH
jgi:hypothetical protein